MSRKADLEQRIRESYTIFQKTEQQLPMALTNVEAARCRHDMEEQRRFITAFLEQYLSLCQQLQVIMPQDIAEIAVAFGYVLPSAQPSRAAPPASPTPTPIRLTGQQYQHLVHALLDAFPSRTGFAQMLRFSLDKSLDAIAGGDDLQTIVFNVIGVAEAEGWTSQLIHAARASNPGNPALLAFAQQVGIE